MLAIRMQRTGRKGHAMFRVVVQESRYTPTSGKVVAHIGHYDPHTKNVTIDAEKATFYLTNGAQPSPRVALLLKNNGVKLPDWVELAEKKTSKTRNAEKLRKNQSKVEKPAEEEVAPAAEPVAEAPADAPEANEPATEETADAPKEEAAETSEAAADDTDEATKA